MAVVWNKHRQIVGRTNSFDDFLQITSNLLNLHRLLKDHNITL